jgi:diacylglycerol kinase family enzyme
MLPALVGTNIAMGVVPLGTGNVWARELKLSLRAEEAILQQLDTEPTLVDTGVMNDQPFLVIGSVGLDAKIVELVESGPKSWGQIAYPLAGIAAAGGIQPLPCRVTIDDEEPFETSMLAGMVTNGRLYGGLVPLSPDAELTDGLLDLALFSGDGAGEIALHTAKVLAGLHQGDPNVVMRGVKRVLIESLNGPMLIESDGDPRGTVQKLEISVRPASVWALGVGRAA